MAVLKRTSNQIGDALEERARKALGGERVKQSGGGKFWKLDVRDQFRFIWSCKSTDKLYLRLTKDLVLEARAGARGMRGSGDQYKGGIIAEIDGIAVVVIELDDFAELITAKPGDIPLLPPSKAAERRHRARRSMLGP